MDIINNSEQILSMLTGVTDNSFSLRPSFIIDTISFHMRSKSSEYWFLAVFISKIHKTNIQFIDLKCKYIFSSLILLSSSQFIKINVKILAQLCNTTYLYFVK